MCGLPSLGRRGQASNPRCLGQLPIMGAMAEIGWANRRGTPKGSWPARMLDRKPRKPAAVSLANKIAVMV